MRDVICPDVLSELLMLENFIQHSPPQKVIKNMDTAVTNFLLISINNRLEEVIRILGNRR